MTRLFEMVAVQPKSKIKASDGLSKGKYKFFTSSNQQTKFYNRMQYDKPALIFGTGGMPSVHYCDTPFATSTDCIVMFSASAASLEAIYHYLSSNLHLLAEGFRGVGLKHITKNYILNIDIPLPNKHFQIEIINTASIITRGQNLRKQQLEKLDQLVKSKFIEMFGDPESNPHGWPTLNLSALYQICSSKRIYQREQTVTGVPFLRLSDSVQRIDNQNQTASLYISDKQYIELYKSGCVPIANDILITTRGTLGKCYIVKAGDKFYFQDGMISWLKCNKTKIEASYTLHLFSHDYIKRQIINASKGATVNFLSLGKLGNLKIIYPDYDLQLKFKTFINQCDICKSDILKSLENLESLKKSLMREYFG